MDLFWSGLAQRASEHTRIVLSAYYPGDSGLSTSLASPFLSTQHQLQLEQILHIHFYFIAFKLYVGTIKLTADERTINTFGQH